MIGDNVTYSLFEEWVASDKIVGWWELKNSLPLNVKLTKAETTMNTFIASRCTTNMTTEVTTDEEDFSQSINQSIV